MPELGYINEDFIDWIKSDWDAHATSALEEIAYMNQSTAKYHGRCVSTLYIPKIFKSVDIERFKNLIKELYGIFDKVIDEYRRNAEYRKLFGFPEELEALILREPRYECKIPIARIDIFYNEKTGEFSFCEFNTDGSSAMNEDRELNIGLMRTKGYKMLEEKFQLSTFELFDSWAKKSLEIYRSVNGAKENPHAAIVDFMESATNNEFEIFADSYRKLGITCEVCEIRELKYRDGKLYGTDGKAIDFIYRRAVTSDIMKYYNEVGDFLAAVRDEAVCLLGDFTTQIVHNKVLYQVLHHSMTKRLLTPREQEYVAEHVPYTIAMDQGDIPYKDMITNKDNWIIKPQDSYGSKGVFAGVEYEDEAEWKTIVDSHRQKDYLVQKFQVPYETVNIDFSNGGDTDFIKVSNLTGLFTYGGEFAGIYSRVSRKQIISTQYSEIALPSIVADDK